MVGLSAYNYRIAVGLICLVIVTLRAQQPNILWIIADDLSNDLECYGNTDVKTPHLNALAAQGVKYTHCYATAPICSSSRSSLITGMYPTSINSISHRPVTKYNLPDGMAPITTYFRDAGYFCVNGNYNISGSGKTDYNFITSGVFDGRHWNQRNPGQPFFAQVQIYQPHRDFVNDADNPIDYNTISTLPGYYPDHPVLNADWAAYLESVQILDKRVGAILQQLEYDGLADNTIVMFFGDHGRPHLRDKQFLYEGGLKTPLIIKYPDGMNAGTIDTQMVSLIDVTAASLKLANIDIPAYMHGIDFLDESVTRDYVFGFRGRSGDANDDMRSVFDGRYKLIWNRLKENSWMQMSGYKKRQYPAYALYYYLDSLRELGSPYNQFMASERPEIELFDLESDPNELNNLADDVNFSTIKDELFQVLQDSLTVYETNWIPETTEEINQAVTASTNSFISGMNNMGLSQYSTDEDIVNYWKQRFGIFDLEPIEEGHINIAKQKPITGSSERVGYELTKANDEDVSSNSSRWLTSMGASYPHWLQIDLQGKFKLSSLRFYTGYNGYGKPINDFKFQYWDNDAWVNLLNVKDNSSAAYSTALDLVVTNKVRLETTRSSNDIVRLFEIEVYGKPQTLGLKDLNLEGVLSVFPNPVTGSYLNVMGQKYIVSHELFNILGIQFKCELKENKLDISQLDSGLYFLRLNSAIVIKFIKE